MEIALMDIIIHTLISPGMYEHVDHVIMTQVSHA